MKKDYIIICLFLVLVGIIIGGVLTATIFDPEISEFNDMKAELEEKSEKVQLLEEQIMELENILLNLSKLNNEFLKIERDLTNLQTLIEDLEKQTNSINKVMGEIVRPNLIWYMESNSLKEFNRGGGIQQRSPYTKLTEIRFEGRPWIKSEIVDPTVSYTGSRVTRAQALRWADSENENRFDEDTDVYAGFRIYLPPDFNVPNNTSNNHWCLIYQLHEQGGDGIFMSLLVNKDGTFKVRHSKVENGELKGYTIKDNLEGIYGRPFTVITHLKSTEDGIVEVWIDGVKVAEDVGDHRASDDGAKPGPFLSVGLYQNVNSNSKYMLFQDGVVGRTFQDVMIFLNSRVVE